MSRDELVEYWKELVEKGERKEAAASIARTQVVLSISERNYIFRRNK